MILSFHRPKFPVSEFIEFFLYYRDYEASHDLDRLLPDGNTTLIIDLGSGVQHIYDNETHIPVQDCRAAWFSGIRSMPITIPSGRGAEMCIAQFRKGRGYAMLQTPMHAFVDTVIDAEQVFGNQILSLREQLLAVKAADKLLLLEDFFARLCQRQHDTNPFVDYAVGEILRQPNAISVESLADKVGFSQKHLIHLFKSHVGLTPKSFIRVARFQQVVEAIEQKGEMPWMEIAFDCGYYDQAHFIHDFTRFSGMTPGDYLVMRNAQRNYVPVK